ncbi:MAG TPA: hypothetical protein VG454_00405 [Gemmatimonadales bacterium]|nr:hypothetical protein [Gemmatimonadales bacterium]
MSAGLAVPATKSRAVPIALVFWFIAALAVGPWLFVTLPFPVPQLTVIALAVLASIAIRPWFETLPWQALVGMHAVRLVGISFLILGASGLIAPVFAARAGWGDIIAALGAIGLVFAGLRPKWLVYAWNSFGLLDLIVAVGTATLVVRSGATPGMELLSHLPLNLVPTFFVPVLVASHIAIYRRLRAS